MRRYTVCIAAFVAMLITAPWAFMLIAMGFDAPGATWGWLHTIVAGLPVSLCVVSITALRWATHGERIPLFAGLALFAIDVAVLIWCWHVA
jgi:hypothetical protein